MHRCALVVGFSHLQLSQILRQGTVRSRLACIGEMSCHPPDLLAKGTGLHLIKFDKAREFRLYPRLQLPVVELDGVTHDWPTRFWIKRSVARTASRGAIPAHHGRKRGSSPRTHRD